MSMAPDKATYIVAVEDLFRVEADSELEAKQEVLERLGSEPFVAHEASVIEREE